MTTSADIAESSLDPHAEALEDAISWCTDNGATVKFHHSGNAQVSYKQGLQIAGKDFLDAVERARGMRD